MLQRAHHGGVHAHVQRFQPVAVAGWIEQLVHGSFVVQIALA